MTLLGTVYIIVSIGVIVKDFFKFIDTFGNKGDKMTTFSERLKFLRTRKGITQQELADIVGVSRTAIAGYERLDKQPNFDVLVKIAQYFDVTTDYLLGLSEQEVEQDSKAYFAEKIDHLFNDRGKFPHGFSKSGSYPEYLYEILMKSYDYEIYYPLSDAAGSIQCSFLDFYDYIDEVNKTFGDLDSKATGLNIGKVKSDSLRAKCSSLITDVNTAFEEFIDYCCGLMEENDLYNHRPNKK